VSGVTWSYVDWKDNLIVDRDAPVLAWRQDKGRRLGWENSHEALAWNVFRSLGPAIGAVFDLEVEGAKYWARHDDAAPWQPFEAARAALEAHLRGPDVNFAAPDVVLLGRGRLIFVDVGLAAPLTTRPPRWFSSASTSAARRRRRAILEAMLAEEPDAGLVLRRGLDEAIRRGFYGPARRLLLARASARRLGHDQSASIASSIALIVSPPTMRRCLEDAERFRALLGPSALPATHVIAWPELAARLPRAATAVRDYLASRTVNRAAAHLCG
jgi:hypothetical protein